MRDLAAMQLRENPGGVLRWMCVCRRDLAPELDTRTEINVPHFVSFARYRLVSDAKWSDITQAYAKHRDSSPLPMDADSGTGV